MPAFDPGSVKFFKTQAAFRKWLERNHDKYDELFVGFYKKHTGKASINWPESVDEGLCFGWIDGIRRKLDEESYCIRFTPRRKTSHWSTLNINRMRELIDQGLARPSGILAWQARRTSNSSKAYHEQEKVDLAPEYRSMIEDNAVARKYFDSKAEGYQKQCTWWIMSARKKETQLKRLKILIESSAAGQVIPPLRWTKRK